MARNGTADPRRLFRYARFWVGLLIGMLIMYMLLRQVELGELRDYMRAVKLPLFALSVVLFMGSFVSRAYQWKYVLADTRATHIRHLFTAMMIGFAGNCVLPARAGEFIRAGVLSRRQGTPFTTSFASVMATRVLDGLCFICLFVAALLALRLDEPLVIPAGRFLAEPFEITPDKLRLAATTLAIVFLAAASSAAVLYVLRDRATRLAELILRPLSKDFAVWVSEKLSRFIEGFTVFGRGSHLARGVLMTFVTWTVAMSSLYPLINAFPMGVPLPWWTVLVAAALSNVGVMIPLSPGFIGTYHACVVVALKLCNPAIDYDVAVAFALVLHASQVVPIVLVGVISLWVENVPLATLQQTSTEPVPSGGTDHAELE